MTLTQQKAQRLANLQAFAGCPAGELVAKNGQEPYPKDYTIIVRYGKRRVHTDETGQRWVKCDGIWWKFPEGIEL